ncbi:hypothetical protein ACA910_007865 [Epithemia clementina (nom. ined.)]
MRLLNSLDYQKLVYRFDVEAKSRRMSSIHNKTEHELAQLPQLRTRVRGHVESIIHAMPRDQTKAYLEARTRAPDITQTESDSLQFVRFCNYDAEAGARRLCYYWTQRRRLFGEIRSFLPLVLTGTGALSSDDLVNLDAGFPSLLPETSTGEKCIFFDRRKGIPGVSIESQLRCLFYMFQLLAQDDRTQIDGALCFIVILTPRHQDLDVSWIDQACSLMGQAFPVKLKVHLLNIPQQNKASLADMLNDGARLKLHSFGLESQVHVQREPYQIRRELMALGLSPAGIPLGFGGSWKFDDFFKWCQTRKEWEREHYKYRLLKSPPNNPCSQGIKRELEEDSDVDLPTPAAKAAKRKLADRLHSRRKRERKQKNENALKEQFAHLVLENQRLLAENARLEQLLEEASVVVAGLSRADTDPAAMP